MKESLARPAAALGPSAESREQAAPDAQHRVTAPACAASIRRMDQPLPTSLLQHGPPYIVLSPRRQTAPLVFASPHSGRDYPPSFLAAARLDALALRRSEDSFVDELFASAPNCGSRCTGSVS